MKKTAIAAVVALTAAAAGELVQWLLLNRMNNGFSFGSALLVILISVLACLGILALFAYLFLSIEEVTSDYVLIWKRLGKVAFLFVMCALAISMLMGLVAALLGQWLTLDIAKGITDWTSIGFVVLLLPVGVHAFFCAGVYGDSLRESFETIRPRYLTLLGIIIAVYGIGRLLVFFQLPDWIGFVVTVALLTCALCLFLRVYQSQYSTRKTFAMRRTK